MSPTVPSAATSIWGTNAGVVPGDWSMRIVLLHVSPPSVDCAKAILEVPVNRLSCQTAYRLPLIGLTANSGSSSLDRTPRPAIATRPTCCTSMGVASDHVLPPSVERMIEAVNVVPPLQRPPLLKGHLPPLLVIRLIPSISTPAAWPAVGITIWFPIVWSFWSGSKMARPLLHVTPLSVVREKNDGPRNAMLWMNALGFAFAFGETSWSHTAYALFAITGSAVTDSLSLSTWVDVSSLAVTGVCQWSPPSVDRLTMIELAPPKPGPLASNESLIEYATWPSAETLTQGSVARLKKPGEPGAAPAQTLNRGWLAASAQVAPPSRETTLVRPLEPPSFQRSCWTAPTMWSGFVGSTATYGSTSASGKFLLPSASWEATSAAQVADPPSGSSGTRTRVP